MSTTRSLLEKPLHQSPHEDIDPQETAEWHDSFYSLLQAHGPQRATFMLSELERLARKMSLDSAVPNLDRVSQNGWLSGQQGLTPGVNTIAPDQQPDFPGDLELEKKLCGLMRWNALAMVVRANAVYGELGGHIASYASAADLFEVGFNHFFRARNAKTQDAGDLVFFQPHSAPGVYARAYLEGRLSDADLAHYRQELAGPRANARGLSSYPHPYLMPDFWQFPTGSMGIGPINSIYQARFMRYLTNRKLKNCNDRKVWGIFGDGEMDEPESVAALTLAARENLDNLVWVINCNLQRLDGPVRGNTRVIDELEQLFKGAGWNVIKVMWGSDWDDLFARDHTGALTQALSDAVDGQMQTFSAKDGAYNREHFFGQNESLRQLAATMSDQDIEGLQRGGHDLLKIYAAYQLAARHQGQPVVILAHTKKGYGMGQAGQGRMTTHSQKNLDEQDLLEFRDRFRLPLTDDQARRVEFYKPEADSPEIRYIQERRRKLGGYLPDRPQSADVLAVPAVQDYARFALVPGDRPMSSTMAFVRMLGNLLKDKHLGPRIVPIVADEARTFGMASLFRQVGIYSSVGQRYEAEDGDSLVGYREAVNGQILEEGITEAGALSSWTAAATSYSAHGITMLPFYIYYSMFGFQRVGDLIWAAADQRPRGFLIGATSGRTTLAGEGLQHQDGNSHLMAATVPNCRSYDPAFAAELAVIVDYGLHEMLTQQRDVFYYITVTNENYVQAALPEDVESHIVRGAYHFARYESDSQINNDHGVTKSGEQDVQIPAHITLLGSGAILTEVIQAAQQLAGMGVVCDVYSVTSWSELARDGMRHKKHRLGQTDALRDFPPIAGADSSGRDDLGDEQPFIHTLLAGSAGPIIAATDYVSLVPESIRAYLPPERTYITLGTDGFGRSDTRAELRAYFGVDAASIVRTALQSQEAY